MSLRRIEMCGMIAVWARIIWGANLIPSWGRVRRVMMRAAEPGMFAHAQPIDMTVRTTARSRRPGEGVGSCGVDGRPPSNSGIPNKSPRWISPGKLSTFLDDNLMPQTRRV